MKKNIIDEGLIIQKSLLSNAEEAEIYQFGGGILIFPIIAPSESDLQVFKKFGLHFPKKINIGKFCTQCGNSVEPYPMSRVYTKSGSQNKLTMTSEYWCSNCNRYFLVGAMNKTGRTCSCGAFLPIHIAFCYNCGNHG